MARKSRVAKKTARTRQRLQPAKEAIIAAKAAGKTEAQQLVVAVEAIRAADPRATYAIAERLARRALDSFNVYTLTGNPAWIDALLRGAQTRARRNRKDCPLTVDDIKTMYEEQEGRCLISGIPFSPEPYFPGSLVARPFAPSLDRINAGGDYTRENVQLVCVAANFAMNRWGLKTLQRLAEGVVATTAARMSPGVSGHGGRSKDSAAA